MIIQPFRKYIVICRGDDGQSYRWNLVVEPGRRAWNILNEVIIVGHIFKGFMILSIQDVTDPNNVLEDDIVELFKQYCIPKFHDSDDDEMDIDDDVPWNKSISLDEFDFAISTSNVGYSAQPTFSQSYRCQICGGVVAGDICTDCMFDWDS